MGLFTLKGQGTGSPLIMALPLRTRSVRRRIPAAPPIFREGNAPPPRLPCCMLRTVEADQRSSFRDIYPRVFRFVFSRTSLPAGDVDDIVQETLAHGWQRRNEFLELSSFESWLLSIARNKIADFWRGRVRSRGADVGRALEKIDEAPIPEDLLKTAELRQCVADALDRLEADYARVLILRYLDDLPVRAIAEQLRETESAVESRLTRARDAFRKLLGGQP
jgi:RNA polymerase sigma-70 factor (ECF subfamily)